MNPTGLRSRVLVLSYAAPTWTSLVAGGFVFLALCPSIYLLFEHLSAYTNPEEQKFLIGVILMVPCYAVESLVSLVDPSIGVDCGILRDCYEAFAMYCFGRYLVACLGGEDRTVEFMERRCRVSSRTALLGYGKRNDSTIEHPFPMKYVLKPWKLGRWFYQVVKIGIVQYMIIKLITAALAVILEAFGVYCEGEFKLNCAYPYMAVAINFSQSWALYCLVQFYNVTKEELSRIKPLAKFLTFKSIVFLTWWQGVGIALLYDLCHFKSSLAQSLQFKSSVQDFVICIEMGIAAVVHLFVFPAKPYKLIPGGGVSALGDYASPDSPLDPDDSTSRTAIKESVRDVFVGGTGYIVEDVKFTVSRAIGPMEKGFSRFHGKLWEISRNMKKTGRGRRKGREMVGSGIDDLLFRGSVSDGGGGGDDDFRRHRKKPGYRSAESGGESSSSTSRNLSIGESEEKR